VHGVSVNKHSSVLQLISWPCRFLIHINKFNTFNIILSRHYGCWTCWQTADRAQETIQTDIRRQHRVHRWVQLLGLRRRRGISWSDGQLSYSVELRSQELGTAMMLNDLEWNCCGLFKIQQNLDVRDFDLSWLVLTSRMRPHGWANGFPTLLLLRRPLSAQSRWRLPQSLNVFFYLYRIPGASQSLHKNNALRIENEYRCSWRFYRSWLITNPAVLLHYR
jgi:hypothetical protein